MSYSDSDDGELIGSDDKAQMAYAGMPPRDPDETSGSVWQRLKSSGALLRVSWPGLVFSMLAIAIARFGSHQAKSNWPVHKQVLAIYAYRLVTEETVPFYWLFIFMFFCSCIMAAVECNVNLSARRVDRRIFAANVALGVWECFFWANTIIEFGKYWVSEPRPDFVPRCFGAGTGIENGTYAAPDSMGYEEVICTNTNEKQLKDARVSFPSGHAASSFVIGLYTSFYLIWMVYFRGIKTQFRNRQVWKSDLYRQIFYLLSLLCFCPFIIGLFITFSRVVDHMHSPADVSFGGLLGTGFALIFFLRVLSEAPERFPKPRSSRHEQYALQ